MCVCIVVSQSRYVHHEFLKSVLCDLGMRILSKFSFNHLCCTNPISCEVWLVCVKTNFIFLETNISDCMCVKLYMYVCFVYCSSPEPTSLLLDKPSEPSLDNVNLR